ncbi:arsenical resistance operon trans-acting repressor ArsD [Salsuginibacillus halophilus]|uniref:Arsenical resistance operon trans-acting repressor ArsD n=1 Tax=Salsuginibacillus halophilus TaxID=517424 RepID=A0A2P8HCU0_9BACI|nr:arsenite efflux transporter metallochaperone ArsD [Salsuginibacillus halophilus]PSL44049.1 arsenical resistance operon trans-acting repressor ArsD [Salsuginibacillus halophilus]
MVLQVFDPAMCCETGVCGPEVDPELARVAGDISALKTKGITVERFNLGNAPAPFVETPAVKALLDAKGADVLPVVLADGKVVKEGAYPSQEEFEAWTGIKLKQLDESQSKGVDIKIR